MTAQFSLSGRVAVITGASRNIGRAIASLFADAGADLMLVARGRAQLELAAREIAASTGRRVETLAADLTITADMEKLADAALRRFGQVDVLVNNAFSSGGTFGRAFLDLDWEDWQTCITANLEAPFRLMKAFAPRMGDGGSVINILSTAAFAPVLGFGPYAATKSALWMMTRYLAKEYAPRIRFNAICPGTIAEDGGAANAAAWANVLHTVPMDRVGRPEELAPTALLLASEASAYITGQVIFVDGGRVSAAAGS